MSQNWDRAIDFAILINVLRDSLTDNYVNDDVMIYSGYGIAAQALTAVIRAHDGRGPQTMLTSTILKALGLSSPDELIGYLLFQTNDLVSKRVVFYNFSVAITAFRTLQR